MEVQFQKKEISCLKSCLIQVQNLEQTQQLRLEEGQSGVAEVLGAWGQPVLRSKEWHSDRLQLTGGVLVWVLYAPEDGSGPKTLSSWIPLRMDFDLPEGLPEGWARVKPILRSVDARPVSDGKLLVRAGIGILAEGWTEGVCPVWQAGETEEDVQLQRSRWPVRIPREAGEKAFRMEEELTLPLSVPPVEKLLYYRMDPVVTDRKVLSDKVVFRGNGNLHLLYQCQEGNLHTWDFELPFSQYAQLRGSYSGDAQADVMPVVTALELEPDGEGKLQLRTGLTGQYLVEDREILETVTDAYSLLRNIELHRQTVSVPGVLDDRREVASVQQVLPVQADLIVDDCFLADFPRLRREEDRMVLEQPGCVQVLYYDGAGKLQSVSRRWEAKKELQAGEGTRLQLLPEPVCGQFQTGGEQLTVTAEVPVALRTWAGEGMDMVSGLSLGEPTVPDPGRPSLILRRSGGESLWDIARQSGSTMEAIRGANGLSGEPEPGQLLLIPVL